MKSLMNQPAMKHNLRERAEKSSQPGLSAQNKLPHDTARNSRSRGISKGRSALPQQFTMLRLFVVLSKHKVSLQTFSKTDLLS